MALIGTVSGSNGTSTTAISGTLIIADEPDSRFPALQSGVKLFVSGNKTSLGADTPNAIFGGDAFVSGAFGTDSYFQMKPVGTLMIPTNTTASYIYTSGSTNDIYFTQYQPGTGYTNTVRLRWIESGLGTGLLSGGTLSTANGATTFSVVSGSGLIVTQNASIGSEPFPVVSRVAWSNVVSQSLTYVTTNQITYITVDSAGAINQSPNPPSIAEKESKIYLGRILHQAGSVTNGTITEPSISYGLAESTFNFQRAFGPLKISGHVLAVSQSSGLGTLGLTKTAGDSYVEGRNYTNNPNSPNLVLAADDPDLVDCKIFREYTDVNGDPVILTNAGTGYTVIDPGQYNNGGTLAAVSNSEWTNQRVYWYPRSVNRALYVYYGTRKFNTFDEAIGGLSTENFTEGANTVGSAVFVGAVTVKGNETDLSSVNSQITQAGLFRGTAIGGGGGGGTTSPGGSNTNIQFNDSSAFNGTNDFRFLKNTGQALVANLVVSGNDPGSLVSSGTLQVKNNSGVVVGSISTGGVISGSSDLQIGGNITGSNLYLAGDIAVIGGDLTSTAAVFNLATNLATQLNVGGTTPTISIGTSTGASTTGIATGTNTIAAAVKNVNIGTGTGPSAIVNVNIGSAGSLGRTTLNNDVALTTGNIIGAPGGGANVMTLISSGNIIAKLDTNNDGPNHKFAVVDWNDVDQFRVLETGNAEIRGDLIVTGSSIVTLTSGTFNLLNTTLTGTLNVGGAVRNMFFGSSVSTGSFLGDIGVSGRSTLGGIIERMSNINGGTGTINFDLIQQSIFYVNGPTGNITANFTNVPITTNRVITPTVILSQSVGASLPIVTAVNIDGASQTINWSGGVTPTGNSGKQDVFGFSLIRSGSAWKVLGQMSTYG